MQLPFYGSFTLREDGGDMADTLYPVLSWLTWPLSVGKWTVEGIETRAVARFRRPAASVFRPLHHGA
jgi:phospholipid-binding lipoprotein MlaA